MFRGSAFKGVGAWLVAAVALAALISAVGGNAQGQAEAAGESAAPATVKFYPSRDVEFSAPPPFGVLHGTQCDANGNIYIQYGSLALESFWENIRSVHPLDLPLRKLSIDSQRVVTFQVGSFEDFDTFSSRAFYVTPNGVVYNLAEACRDRPDTGTHESCVWVVTRYKDDGTVDSAAKLCPPMGKHLYPLKIAAFPDGNLLAVGTIRDEPGDPTLFAGLFDRSGDLLRELTLASAVGPAPAVTPTPSENPAAGKPPDGLSDSDRQTAELPAWTRLVMVLVEGRVSGAPDGTVYLLRGRSPQKLDVVSSDGSVVPKHDIIPPGGGLTPLDASVSAQGQLVVYYVHGATPQDSSRYRVTALIDPETGKVISTYDVPPDAGVPACVTWKGEFLFTRRSNSGHLEVVGYSPLH